MAVQFIDEAPPRRRVVNINLKRVTSVLKSRPGKWAEIRVYSGKRKQNGYVYAHNCKTARNRSLSPQEGFEVHAASDGDGSVIVYARYVGRHGEHATPSEGEALAYADLAGG